MKLSKKISLLEMIIVAAIGITIIFATIRYFNVTRSSVKVSHAIQQIQMLTKASYDWLSQQKQDDFSSANGGTPISMQTLIKSQETKKVHQEFKDPWQGDIHVEPGSDPSHIKITLNNVPKDACQKLSKHLDHSSLITPPTCDKAFNQYTGEF